MLIKCWKTSPIRPDSLDLWSLFSALWCMNDCCTSLVLMQHRVESQPSSPSVLKSRELKTESKFCYWFLIVISIVKRVNLTPKKSVSVEDWNPNNYRGICAKTFYHMEKAVTCDLNQDCERCNWNSFWESNLCDHVSEVQGLDLFEIAQFAFKGTAALKRGILLKL